MWKVLRARPNLRLYSIKHATEEPLKYTNTINLPKTKFPSRLSALKREQLERQLVENTFARSYRLQEQHHVEPTFVLHDGPPYANGNLHMGHALNKILKDITLRQYAVKGLKVNYVPGWDCHGLPIELRAMAMSRGSESIKDAISIRRKCRQFALDAVERQKSEFRSWGILSDWSDENIYLTLSADFIMNQLKMFMEFYEKGLVYRDMKPVYWSPSSRTALAEAELEYDDNFVSPSVYVRFALRTLPQSVSLGVPLGDVYALVWTTTPWTLPSNQAICYNANLEYAFVRLHRCDKTAPENDVYLIGLDLVEDFEKTTNIRCEVLERITGSALMDCTYKHPVDSEGETLPFLDSSHVQSTKGTGLVHTAPAHGPDDFLICLANKIAVKSLVNEEGLYSSEAPAFLRGRAVLEDGDKLVLQHIAEDVVFASNLTHAYPIDWRTKQPVIIRASDQWFMNTSALKERALEEIEKIKIYPPINAEASKRALLSQVRKRPYWCISRQRAWGVPIPVFYKKCSGEVVANKQILQHICDIVEREGNIDFWWSKSEEELLPGSILEELNLHPSDLTKGADIFDIWFDSGCTWSHVLKDEKISDLYLEGYDQFTGWFQSSLLTSVAARNCAPYRALFVHGFTVDENGRKMSKSLGNVISPKDITKKYGVDVLRWWVASHGTQHTSIPVSDKLLQQSAESIGKIRSVLRYLNGVIGKRTSSATTIFHGRQTHLNRYLLHKLANFESEIEALYSNYEYNRVVAMIQNFVANQISAVYVNLVKDRLYCGSNEDFTNIRYVLQNCHALLSKALWPIVPFLVEESWSYYDGESSFDQQIVKADPGWRDDQVESVVEAALGVKRIVNQKATDKNPWTLALEIVCSSVEQLAQLQKLQSPLNTPVVDSELCELLQVGSVVLSDTPSADGECLVGVVGQDLPLCPRCRRFALSSGHSTCARCTAVLRLNKLENGTSYQKISY